MYVGPRLSRFYIAVSRNEGTDVYGLPVAEKTYLFKEIYRNHDKEPSKGRSFRLQVGFQVTQTAAIAACEGGTRWRFAMQLLPRCALRQGSDEKQKPLDSCGLYIIN